MTEDNVYKDGVVFAGQEALKIRLATNVSWEDLDAANSLNIKYKKPDGTEGQWDAVLEAEPNPTGRIYYDIQPGDIPAASEGWWKVWTWVEFSDGRTAPGNPLHVKFRKEGT